MNPYFTRNVAATAINIIDGMALQANLHVIQPAYEEAGMGFIEFSCWVAGIAEQLNRHVDSLPVADEADGCRVDQAFPGVWDYEVAYPLGQWILERIQHKGELPDGQLAVEHGRALTDKFFAQGEQA